MRLEDAPDVLTVPEVARLLRIGRNAAYDLIGDGELYGRHIGRAIRVPKSAVVAYLAGQSPARATSLTALSGGRGQS